MSDMSAAASTGAVEETGDFFTAGQNSSPADLREGRPPAERRGTVRVFVADPHLDGTDSPAALSFRLLLRRLIAERAKRPVELYVLGDLFSFWYEYRRAVFKLYEKEVTALREAAAAGVKLFLLAGNRDFAYGGFARREWRAELPGDGTAVTLSDGRRAWLEHGDLLCTADVRYLRWRRVVRSAPVRLLFRLLPWFAARRLIAAARRRTTADKETKEPKTLAISLDAARTRLETQNCSLLLCGHLHRPMQALVAPGRKVRVLPAWLKGGYALRDADGGLTVWEQEQPPKKIGDLL